MTGAEDQETQGSRSTPSADGDRGEAARAGSGGLASAILLFILSFILSAVFFTLIWSARELDRELAASHRTSTERVPSPWPSGLLLVCVTICDLSLARHRDRLKGSIVRQAVAIGLGSAVGLSGLGWVVFIAAVLLVHGPPI